ncbi:hypothetical protein B7P43_G17863 [Cryptotermes secundus]|uniref:PiggyBac transposable element-derived protein domain-containing protein n=1 Tax=Cryptotermes secundus TaxID=105785 RepID=A0A2J7R029_9NEOP|nr:hypothetical protein B7P43_G17863 [Cryptotermes secundus]
MLCQETNRYYLQHREEYDRSYKVLKWADVTSAETRKIFAIIFLMGHTRRDNLKEHWSTDPFFKSTSGYIGNLEIYYGEGKKLQETIVSVLESYLYQNYHVYQDSYYNNVVTAEYLLLRKVRVCGTIRRKTIKWTKKVALWLINCAILNSFLVYKNLNPDLKLKYKAFLLNVAKAWATDQMVAAE